VLTFVKRPAVAIFAFYALSALGNSALAGYSEKPYQIGPWAVLNRLDPITDKPNVKVQTPLDDRLGPFLSIVCEDGQPFLTFGIPGVVLKTRELVSLNLRIDRTDPTKTRLQAVGPDLMVARLTQATYKKITNAELIAAYIERDRENNNGQGWELQFSVSKSTEAFKPMLAACPIESAHEGALEKFEPDRSRSAPEKSPDDATGPQK
jgi:hypothetical protein